MGIAPVLRFFICRLGVFVCVGGGDRSAVHGHDNDHDHHNLSSRVDSQIFLRNSDQDCLLQASEGHRPAQVIAREFQVPSRDIQDTYFSSLGAPVSQTVGRSA